MVQLQMLTQTLKIKLTKVYHEMLTKDVKSLVFVEFFYPIKYFSLAKQKSTMKGLVKLFRKKSFRK